jgi:hypothetical protein
MKSRFSAFRLSSKRGEHPSQLRDGIDSGSFWFLFWNESDAANDVHIFYALVVDVVSRFSRPSRVSQKRVVKRFHQSHRLRAICD